MKHSKIMKLREHSFWSNPCFFYLLIVGVLEFLLMVCGISVYYEHKNYLLFPVFMFFGAAFMQNLTASAKRKLLLGVLAMIWFLVIQKHRNAMGWKLYPFSWFPAIYLMAYPFAAVTQDSGENNGLKLYAMLFIAASCVLMGYGALLMTEKVPKCLDGVVYFHDYSRFALMWNPNITGCIFMVCTVLCLVLSICADALFFRVFYAIVAVFSFLTMTLTNSRSSILSICVLFGGLLFFRMHTGGVKRLLISFVVTSIVIIGIYSLSNQIYSIHVDRLISHYTEEIAEPEESQITDGNEISVPDLIGTESELFFSGAKSIPGSVANFSQVFSAQTLSVSKNFDFELHVLEHQKLGRKIKYDFANMSGRTPVWWAALKAIRDDPSVLVWGCEYVGDILSLYTEQPYDHAHNSWAQITLSIGLPGAIIALIFTWIAVWNSMVLLWSKIVPLWKKCIALLVLGLLFAGFLEPYLFFSNQFFHFIDFTFFLCLGYVRVWVEALPRRFDTKRFPFCLL